MSRFVSERSTSAVPSFRAALGLCFLAAASIGGCQTTDVLPSRSDVAANIENRFGAGISDSLEPGEVLVPPGVNFDDGISDDEAVSVALWNNAALQEVLAELGISNAQLLDAGLISDPQLVMLFPLGPKQLELTAFQSIDVLWLQPIRIRAATLDLDRVSRVMVQSGLDVIRDVRVAHANLQLAQQQSELAREAEALRTEIATLGRKRLAAGDISELEVAALQIDSLQAKATAARTKQDVEIAQQRLRTLIGLTMYADQIDAASDDLLLIPIQNSDALTNEALALRPDLRAAEIAIETTAERARLARNQFMTIDAVVDSNSRGRRGFEAGPGMRFTLPLFNRNRGGIAIADAQAQRADRQYVTVRDRVTLEVRTAYAQLEQAQQNLQLVRGEILPLLSQTNELARRNFENGGATYFLILQTTGQYLDARMRELQLIADLRRAIAELERSVGRKVEVRVLNVEEPKALVLEPARSLPEPLLRSVSNSRWRATNAASFVEAGR